MQWTLLHPFFYFQKVRGQYPHHAPILSVSEAERNPLITPKTIVVKGNMIHHSHSVLADYYAIS